MSSRGFVINAPSATTMPTATKTTVRIDSFIEKIFRSRNSQRIEFRVPGFMFQARTFSTLNLKLETWNLKLIAYSRIRDRDTPSRSRIRRRAHTTRPTKSGKMGGNTVAFNL